MQIRVLRFPRLPLLPLTLAAAPLALAPALLAGCGSSSPASSPDAALVFTRDTGVEAAPHADAPPADAPPAEVGSDANGAVSTTYPAFTVDAPQIQSNQGKVLKAPVIVTVTWPLDDRNITTWEALGDSIGGSPFWAATTSEYGVGPATSGASAHVRMVTPLPASISYTALESYVLAQITATPPQPDAGAPDAAPGDGGSADGGVDGGAGDAAPTDPAWPAPVSVGGDVQTIYAVYIPASVTVTDPGSGASFCAYGSSGYHSNVTVGAASVAYAVSLDCAPGSLPPEEETAVHELIEAATDPYPNGALGFVNFDNNHIAWELENGGLGSIELGDVCQNWADSYYQETGTFPYWAQRTWSNASMAAGHAPCVPRPSGAYYGMTLLPSQAQSVSINLAAVGGGPTTTRAFRAPVGQAVTFQVGFYSDAATPPWTIGYDLPATAPLFNFTTNKTPGNGTATVTIDKTSGQNGEIANVTVTPTAAGDLGFQIMTITWDPPPAAQAGSFAPHFLPILIVNQ